MVIRSKAWCLTTVLVFTLLSCSTTQKLRRTLPRQCREFANSPVCVKKGQQVYYPVRLVHHRKDLWGPNVDKKGGGPQDWEKVLDDEGEKRV